MLYVLTRNRIARLISPKTDDRLVTLISKTLIVLIPINPYCHLKLPNHIKFHQNSTK